MRRNTDKTGAAALAYLAFFIYAVSTGLLGTMLSDFGLGDYGPRYAAERRPVCSRVRPSRCAS